MRSKKEKEQRIDEVAAPMPKMPCEDDRPKEKPKKKKKKKVKPEMIGLPETEGSS